MSTTEKKESSALEESIQTFLAKKYESIFVFEQLVIQPNGDFSGTVRIRTNISTSESIHPLINISRNEPIHPPINISTSESIDYLKDIQSNLIKSKIDIIINTLLKSWNVTSFDLAIKKVQEAIHTLHTANKTCVDRTEWISCENKCKSIIHPMIDAEINSTAYILRCLIASVLTVSDGIIKFQINGDLTGIWSEDMKHIQITQLGNNTSSTTGRLIMGFGPSASGKTYWAKTLIQLFNSADTNFPNTFLSIDGGIYRTCSLIYQTIVNETKKICIAGINNLVLPEFNILKPFNKSLFSSDIIKGHIIHFLKLQKTINISLYVPETLGDCGHLRLKPCENKYKDFITITNDKNWIGVLIWQHKTAEKCTYTDLRKCVGCTESGKRREIEEGKKYSSGAYDHSLSEGRIHYRKAPGGNYDIHNCGRNDGISVLTDNTLYTQDKLNIRTILLDPANAEKYHYEYTSK